jgi:hypothetical protein
MTECHHLSDRMPAVAHGRAHWTAADEAHLSRCADCRAEWDLVRAAGRIGGGLPPLGDRDGLAADVLRRVAEAPEIGAPRRALRWAGGLAAAAALALAVWSGALRQEPGGPEGPGGVAVAAESLSTAQADSLLDVEEPQLAGWSMLETPTLGDLDEDELERLLRTWEG